MLVPEILEEERGDRGFRGEIPGAEVVQAVVEGDAVIFPGGQGGERVFQDALGNAGCLQRNAFLSSVRGIIDAGEAVRLQKYDILIYHGDGGNATGRAEKGPGEAF